jgi:hypothetical protein
MVGTEILSFSTNKQKTIVFRELPHVGAAVRSAMLCCFRCNLN